MSEVSRTLQEHADWLDAHVRWFTIQPDHPGWSVEWGTAEWSPPSGVFDVSVWVEQPRTKRTVTGDTIKRALAAACEQVRQEQGNTPGG